MDDIPKHLRTIASRGHTTDEDNQWLFDVADQFDNVLLPGAPREQLIAEIVSLTSALAEAMSLLSEVDSDANNIQLDIARFQRRHSRVLGER